MYNLFKGDRDYTNMLSFVNKIANKKHWTYISDNYDFSKYYQRMQ